MTPSPSPTPSSSPGSSHPTSSPTASRIDPRPTLSSTSRPPFVPLSLPPISQFELSQPTSTNPYQHQHQHLHSVHDAQGSTMAAAAGGSGGMLLSRSPSIAVPTPSGSPTLSQQQATRRSPQQHQHQQPEYARERSDDSNSTTPPAAASASASFPDIRNNSPPAPTAISSSLYTTQGQITQTQTLESQQQQYHQTLTGESSLRHGAAAAAEEQEQDTVVPKFLLKKKRTRTLTTPHQSAVLHALLSQSRFPTTAMREEVGRSIGLSARKVQVWFQNQRQKARKPRYQNTTSSSQSTQTLSPRETQATTSQYSIYATSSTSPESGAATSSSSGAGPSSSSSVFSSQSQQSVVLDTSMLSAGARGIPGSLLEGFHGVTTPGGGGGSGDGGGGMFAAGPAGRLSMSPPSHYVPYSHSHSHLTQQEPPYGTTRSLHPLSSSFNPRDEPPIQLPPLRFDNPTLHGRRPRQKILRGSSSIPSLARLEISPQRSRSSSPSGAEPPRGGSGGAGSPGNAPSGITASLGPCSSRLPVLPPPVTLQPTPLWDWDRPLPPSLDRIASDSSGASGGAAAGEGSDFDLLGDSRGRPRRTSDPSIHTAMGVLQRPQLSLALNLETQQQQAAPPPLLTQPWPLPTPCSPVEDFPPPPPSSSSSSGLVRRYDPIHATRTLADEPPHTPFAYGISSGSGSVFRRPTTAEEQQQQSRRSSYPYIYRRIPTPGQSSQGRLRSPAAAAPAPASGGQLEEGGDSSSHSSLEEFPRE